MPKRNNAPRCIVIAGPNGAGKTTFARRYLPEEGVVHFMNADLLAIGLSPLKPELAAARAGRLVLQRLDHFAAERVDFAFETTFSGLGYVRRIRAWRRAGYRIEMVYLQLQSTRLALKRIAARVRGGGHDVPRSDVFRRFSRSLVNFKRIYQTLADVCNAYDNSGREAVASEEHPMNIDRTGRKVPTTAAKIGRALRRAAQDARRTARMHGVPIYVWEKGRILALTP